MLENRATAILVLSFLLFSPNETSAQDGDINRLNEMISSCPAGWYGQAEFQDSLVTDELLLPSQLEGHQVLVFQLRHKKFVDLDTSFGRLSVGSFMVEQHLNIFLFDKKMVDSVLCHYSKVDSILSFYSFDTKSYTGIIGPFMDLGEQIYSETDEMLCILQSYFRDEYEEF